MGQTYNCQTLLPVGEKIKSLLNKSCISESNMRSILANRGVFVSDGTKKTTIPLLTLSILSPNEFETLQEFQKTKEDSLKIKTSKSISLTGSNLNTIVPLDIISSESLVEDISTFSFNSDLNFLIANPNQLTLDYEILREDISKDWVDSQSTFAGRVEIVKNPSDSEITFKNEFTSTETENINYKIIKVVSNYLKANNEMSSSDTLIEITSEKFNNAERFSFMLQLTNDSPNGFLRFQAVKNVEIGPDKTIKLPNEGKWMEGSVKNIIINSEKGETLENIEYISNTVYHESLILREVQAQYRFDFGSIKGTCIIEYGFPHYFRNYARGKSFESSIAKIYFAKDSSSNSYKSASRKVLDEFEKLYQEKYEILKPTK